MNASVNKIKSRTNLSRRGFTLVEMLVVIAIIGILAAILVPVISSALARANEFAISNDMQVQIKQSLESFKNKNSVYPTDFGNPFTLRPIVNKLSARHAYERAGAGALVNLADPTDTATWYGTDVLENPHFFRNTSTVQFRTPNTIDAAESWVFWLYETTINQEWPLGAVWDVNTSQYILDPNWISVWRGNAYMTFDEKRFTDIDNDGWFEYAPPKGEPGVPYVYFDSRTYMHNLDTTTGVYTLPTQAIFAQYPPHPLNVPAYDAGWNPANYEEFGVAQPYWKSAFIPQEASGYQLVAPGLDGQFGTDKGGLVPYDITTIADRKQFPSALNMVLQDRDNFSTISDGRVDKGFDD